MPQNKVSSTTTHVTLNTINNVVLCSNKIESQKLKETATNMINKIVSQGQSIMRLLVGSFVVSNSKSTSSLQLLRMPDLKKKLWLNLHQQECRPPLTCGHNIQFQSVGVLSSALKFRAPHNTFLHVWELCALIAI